MFIIGCNNLILTLNRQGRKPSMGEVRCVWTPGVVVWMVLLLVCWSSRVEGQCPPGVMPGDCTCTPDQQGKYHLDCSCPTRYQDLVISASAIPTHTYSIKFSKCSGSVEVEEDTFNHLPNLENIAFHSIASLTFHNSSVQPFITILDKTFTLTLEDISALAFEEEAVVFYSDSMDAAMYKISITDSTITEFGKYSIITPLGELLLRNVTFSQTLEEHTVDVGFDGVKVTLDALDATAGLGSEWLVGNVTYLNITRSNLTLLPRAFSAVEMTPPNPTIILVDNQFGSVISGGRDTPSSDRLASLPTQALSVYLHSDSNTHISASGNRLTSCRCEDLKWLLEEDPKNINNNTTRLKQAVQASLQTGCEDRNLNYVLDECQDAPSGAKASYPMHGLAFSYTVLLGCVACFLFAHTHNNA
ncbi:hypothetical protein Pmani_034132 [Petrolisthes manimaculis]|uniref:Uncharacterized protein n=1 Tax=Petrolisthes manimaculis TaxID=1843537 RepID=A0AAE1TQ15_9EUCA|nr:hypothetical protein Pmani_034132 [Petrolisthes manimaculis]